MLIPLLGESVPFLLLFGAEGYKGRLNQNTLQCFRGDYQRAVG